MRFSRQRGKSNTISVDYVLPDYTHIKRGFIRTPDQPVNKQEQVTVTLLFQPSKTLPHTNLYSFIHAYYRL